WAVMSPGECLSFLCFTAAFLAPGFADGEGRLILLYPGILFPLPYAALAVWRLFLESWRGGVRNALLCLGGAAAFPLLGCFGLRGHMVWILLSALPALFLRPRGRFTPTPW